jgi:2,3-bisphosphoglycerate-independent phosphoglycerate mutase
MMREEELVSELALAEGARMVLLVLDGLGGLPHPDTGLTELETASTPNLDALAARSACGLIHPVAPGVTPGSGPGHLSLFGYDPQEHEIGRGILSALGLGLEVGPGDVAARVNFCTVSGGVVTDRRAGRISTEVNGEMCAIIRAKVEVPGLSFTITPEKDHRAALIFSGDGLSPAVTDSDPERTGMAPLAVEPRDPADGRAARTAELVNAFLEEAGKALEGQSPANMILTRGFSGHPHTPGMAERYRVKAAAIATYPMYRGLARLVGMEVLETGDDFASELETLAAAWESYDYFFLHYKKTDSAGEDGDFARKAACIEEVDDLLPRILDLRPEVLAVTGDHSTPAVLKGHSWHPCPLILNSPWELTGATQRFSERECSRGVLGIFNAVHLITLMLAGGRRLSKFGA